MRKFAILALASSAIIGPMTAAERAKGRYMRAPDHESPADAAFREFEQSGEVEVGDTNKAPDPEPVTKPRRAPKPAATPVAPKIEETKEGEDPDAGEDEGDEDDTGEDEGGEPEKDADGKPKPRQKASDRIRELNKRLRDSERLRLADRDLYEKGGLPGTKPADTKQAELGEAPNPSDAEKYPLGHLDDRYIEDKLEWLANKKAGEQADTVLQRQQASEAAQAAETRRTEILTQVDDIVSKAGEDFPDFEDKVVKTGLAGEWKLDEPTFRAAHAADHGAQILYDLSQDKEEAAWLAQQSPKRQREYVKEANDEIAKTKQPRRIPRADAPPTTTTRGASSKTTIKPDTDNLDDFEKAWKSDAKRS